MGLVHENGVRTIMDENGTVRARMSDLGIRYLDQNRNVGWSSPEH